MDLYAYAQIGALDKLAKDNGIDIPRLRGYRLMSEEKPVSSEEIGQMIKDGEIEACEDLCHSYPLWCLNPILRHHGDKTAYLCDYYMVKNHKRDDNDGREYVDIRWDRIHGKKRKILKFKIKKMRRRIEQQFEMWNRYAGKENVLYIHSRIGGRNWGFCGGNELMTQPWFLDRVDDYFDCTYCDIYASLNTQKSKQED